VVTILSGLIMVLMLCG